MAGTIDPACTISCQTPVNPLDMSEYTVNIRLYGTLVHFVAHLVFQELYSLVTAASCGVLDRANEMRSFRTIVRCCSLQRPQRS